MINALDAPFSTSGIGKKWSQAAVQASLQEARDMICLVIIFQALLAFEQFCALLSDLTFSNLHMLCLVEGGQLWKFTRSFSRQIFFVGLFDFVLKLEFSSTVVLDVATFSKFKVTVLSLEVLKGFWSDSDPRASFEIQLMLIVRPAAKDTSLNLQMGGPAFVCDFVLTIWEEGEISSHGKAIIDPKFQKFANQQWICGLC